MRSAYNIKGSTFNCQSRYGCLTISVFPGYPELRDGVAIGIRCAI